MKRYKILLIGFLLIYNAEAQERYAVVINEIMVDPSPQVGLPNHEWIELKNRSSATINLQNWRIADASGQSGPMPFFMLEPDSLVIVCSATASNMLANFGKTIVVTSFPSLDNEAEVLSLRTDLGMTMHALNYTAEWYGNELKKEGGWSLEMIDTNYPCENENNWIASLEPIGGTPGKINSVIGVLQTATAPQLLRAYTSNDRFIHLIFSKPIDSLSCTNVSSYIIEGGLNISLVKAIAPLFTEVLLTTAYPMIKHVVYTIETKNIKDCKKEEWMSGKKLKFGLAEDPANGECLINEILFNPRPNSFDYVEIYNRSEKILDAAKLFIATRNTMGQLTSIKPLSNTPFLIFPGDYIVITENINSLAFNYLVKEPANVLVTSSLPPFPDTQGDVIILNAQGQVIDEVKYQDDWHFKLITDADGVALERIDPAGPSGDPSNWHSAASSAGYGTPTYQNSQYRGLLNTTTAIEVIPRVFSPDNDGFDDIMRIQYKVNEPGYVANITIFDVVGRPVKQLVRAALLGNIGYWNWDGLDDKGQRISAGIYIILTEIFNLQGKSKKFKNIVVLARRLK